MRYTIARLLIFLSVSFSVFTLEAKVHYTAVLQHSNSVTAFNGDSALIKAAAAAVEGDAIYLSEGNFKGATITVPLKIYGAGENTVTGQIVLNFPKTDAATHIEGINSNSSIDLRNAYNATIHRSNFNSIRYIGNSSIYKEADNIVFKQCKIGTGTFGEINRLVLENCIITTIAQNIYTCDVMPIIKNSYVATDKSERYTYSNCTIRTISAGTNEKSLFNCVLGTTPNEDCRVQDCTILSTGEFDALFKDQETLELTDAAASTYRGDDGKEIGIYGGNFPYTLIPAIPEITRAAHPMSPTADGKLPFEVTIEIRN
ncbi:MAG: hypothetical protein K2L46_00710 [Paramuribaculum sp.]|nr:hypothetical protein [Paramuribaculum sp.]MDE6487779.1 hypothetical protein [Paramuribaculum sp.]